LNFSRANIGKAAVIACVLGFGIERLRGARAGLRGQLTPNRGRSRRVRDGARRPYQVMQLWASDAGMTVLESGAGGGWFRGCCRRTGPSGKVTAQFGRAGVTADNGRRRKTSPRRSATPKRPSST